MNEFIGSLDEIESLKKQKRFDEAWRAANKAVIELAKRHDEMWYLMYYQMADILAREKKWSQALFHMGLVIHYHKGLGGITHEKFVVRLLKKYQKEALLDKYIELCINTEPKELEKKILDLIKP